MLGSCLGLSSWKLPRSWASCPGLTYFQDSAAPLEETQAAGGVRNSWLLRWTVKSPEAKEQFSVPWAFPASILFIKPPGVGGNKIILIFQFL